MQANQIIHKLLCIVWPIERKELRKFLPMSFLWFCITFSYHLLRILKDSLVIPTLGAEVLSFLKLWAVLPSAIFFMILYAKLTNFVKAEYIFFYVTGFFIAFIALFTFVFFPYQEYFHPDPAQVVRLVETYPYLKWFLMIFSKWTFAIVYVIAELWIGLMGSLLFWQLANKISSTNEAKRFYPMFGFLGALAPWLVGKITKILARAEAADITWFNWEGNNSLMFVQTSMSIVLVICFVCMYLYHWMESRVLTDPRFYTPKPQKEKKKKPTLRESFYTIFTSKYLGLIVTLVLAYGISINLVEGPWKAKVRELYPSQNQYAYFMGGYTEKMGLILMVTMLMGSNILRHFGWFVGALMTPLVIGITGLGFFIFVVFSDTVNKYLEVYFSVGSLYLAVMLGQIQNLLSKATKYSLFDSTKEMAYIPIDEELKTKGKAAVDVVGARLGKSGGALIQSTLLMLFPAANIITISPCLMVIFIAIIAGWIYAVVGLNKEYKRHLAHEQ